MTSDELIIELQKLPKGTRIVFDGGQGYIDVNSVSFPDGEKPRDYISGYDIPRNAAELSSF